MKADDKLFFYELLKKLQNADIERHFTSVDHTVADIIGGPIAGSAAAIGTAFAGPLVGFLSSAVFAGIAATILATDKWKDEAKKAEEELEKADSAIKSKVINDYISSRKNYYKAVSDAEMGNQLSQLNFLKSIENQKVKPTNFFLDENLKIPKVFSADENRISADENRISADENRISADENKIEDTHSIVGNDIYDGKLQFANLMNAINPVNPIGKKKKPTTTTRTTGRL